MNDSKKALMDRHIKRVEKWLKRCITACKQGSWGDALAEAECLEAETKGLREKLWGAVEHEVLGTGARSIVYTALKVVVLALAIVFSAVIPASLDSESGVLESAPQGESVFILSSTESDIINALRENLSSGNSGRDFVPVEIPEEAPVAEPNGSVAMAAERSGPAPENIVPADAEPAPLVEEEAQVARRPSADEVISLIQVGQRALRSSEPGVTILQ